MHKCPVKHSNKGEKIPANADFHPAPMLIIQVMDWSVIRTLDDETPTTSWNLTRNRETRTPCWTQACGGACLQAPGGQAFAPGAWSGKTRKDYTRPPPHGPTTRRVDHRGRVRWLPGSRRRRVPGHADSWRQRLALGKWNVTSLMNKELELVCEVENYSWASLYK